MRITKILTTSLLVLLCLSLNACAIGIASVGGDIAGPVLNTLLDPLSAVKPCPDCPKGMTPEQYIKQQRQMLTKAQEAAIRQYNSGKNTASLPGATTASTYNTSGK